MRDQGRMVNPARECGSDFAEHGRSLDHRCRDPVQADRPEISFGVDQRVVLIDRFPRSGIERERRNFDNAIMPAKAGGFAIDDDERA